MRLGISLAIDSDLLPVVPEVAGIVEAFGLDLLWIRPDGKGWASSLTSAAATATTTTSIVVVQDVLLQGFHPLYLAEERHVTDQLLGGRLAVALDGAPDEQAEVADILFAAAASRPFRHEGARWTIPANLPGNKINPEYRIRVTPQPASLSPQIWVHSADSGARGVPVIDAMDAWAVLDTSGTLSERHAPRPAVRSWDPRSERAAAFAARLQAEQWPAGPDLVAVRITAPPLTSAWRTAVSALASIVRPRLQIDNLPDGLERFWDEELGSGEGLEHSKNAKENQ